MRFYFVFPYVLNSFGMEILKLIVPRSSSWHVILKYTVDVYTVMYTLTGVQKGYII